MDQYLDLFRGQAKKPVGLDYLQGLVQQCRRVYRNFRAHLPCGVIEGFLDGGLGALEIPLDDVGEVRPVAVADSDAETARRTAERFELAACKSAEALLALRRLVGRWVVRTPHLSLINILARRRIVPELMPWNGRSAPLVSVVLEVMNDLGWLVEARRRLMELVAPLRVPAPASASDNAARVVCELLEKGS